MLAALEGLPLAAHLRASAWTYPLVSAGHVLGIALLVGAVVPMDMRVLAGRDGPAAVRWLRPWAAAGLVLAAACGAALFLVRATEYAANPWFRAKLAVILLALVNGAVRLRLDRMPAARARLAAVLSLVLWPAALPCGRMIGYS